jgi:hypothetical protein
LVNDIRQAQLDGKSQSERNEYESVLGVGGHQSNSLHIFKGGYVRIDEPIRKMVAKSRLQLSVHGGIETFFSSTTDADHRII